MARSHGPKTPERNGYVAAAIGASILLAGANASEALVELSNLAARINDALLAGPGRVRLRVNVQADGIARLAVAGTGLVLGPVGHDDVDLMISGMDIGLHGACSQKWAADADRPPGSGRYRGSAPPAQASD